LELYLLLFLIILLVSANLLIYSGLVKEFNIGSFAPVDNKCAAVVISARDEEQNIPAICRELQHQDYDNFSINIVDDYSRDNTFEITAELKNEIPNIRVIKNELPQGKKNALTTAVNNTNEEYILLTDADCFPESKWISSYLSRFSQGFDLLFGLAPFYTNNKLVAKISAFENLRSFILSISAAFFNIPYSAAGRNIGYKRSSFYNIGGYKNIMEIPFGDDGLLIREAAANKLKIGTVLTPGSSVFTYPKQTFKEYFIQRKRHTRTSFYYSFKTRLMLGVWHIINFAPFAILPLITLNSFFILPLVVKLSADIIMVMKVQSEFGYDFKIREAVYLQILYEIFIIVNFLNALTGRIKWK
jgi:cellulose synthase/poly-beta-1,6-N-acetylglucosamine synthase-like glycosyltransferase